MKTVTKSIEIKIKDPAGVVLLSTTVGNGNKGGGNVKNEVGQKIAKGLLSNFHLGNGSALNGKKYMVTTNVLDINPYRDDTPITHLFSGTALDERKVELTDEAEADGIVAFIIEYSFIK